MDRPHVVWILHPAFSVWKVFAEELFVLEIYEGDLKSKVS
jgi:hypothetical protein